eukprot:jgi/Mesvir1/5022/Mv02233-RA.2
MARPFCNSLKKEFLRGNVWLDGIPSSQLCTSRWHPQGHVWYLAWRAFAAAYFSAWVIGIGVHSGARAHPPDGGKWLIYLTNVTGILLAAYFCMALYAAAISTWKGDHGNEDSTTGDALGEGEHHQLMCSPPHLPLGYRLVWAHRTAAFTSSALVVLLYWALIHEGNVWTAINLHMHGVNLVLVLIDLAVSSAPFRLLHIFCAYAWCIAWLIFSFIYYGAGGTDVNGAPHIYDPLDYGDHLGLAVGYIIAVLLVAIPLVHLALWTWAWVWAKCGAGSQTQHAAMQPVPLESFPKDQLP